MENSEGEAGGGELGKWKCPRLPGNNASEDDEAEVSEIERTGAGRAGVGSPLGGVPRGIDSRRGISPDYARQPP